MQLLSTFLRLKDGFISGLQKTIKSKFEKSEQNTEFVFGVMEDYNASTGNYCNCEAYNYFDVVRNLDDGTYSLSIETYIFFEKEDGERNYLYSILDRFTKFMEDNNYNTHWEVSLYGAFTQGVNINTRFNSIEEAYGTFKYLIGGYINQ